DGVAWHLRRALLQPGGSGGPVLALRRPGLDLPLPAALPDRLSLRGTLTSMASSSNNGTLNQHHVAPVFFYVLVFLGLIVGTVLTVVVAKFDLGPLNNIVMLAVAMA